MRRLKSEERPCPPKRPRAAKRPAGERRKPTARRGQSRRRFQIGRRTALAGAALFAGALVLGSLGWLWSSGWVGRQVAVIGDGFYRMTAESGLAVEEVLVEGRERTSRAELLATLGIARGDPMLAFDLDELRRRVEALPWVHSAAIERRLPSLIYLRIEERAPMAVWQLDGRFSIIDQEGAVVPGIRPEAFASLPLIVGPGAPAQGAKLIRMLESEPELMARVISATWVRERRWNLDLDDGIKVRLPETDAAQAWAQLARFERRHGILQRDVASIDLRMPDRLVVRTLSGTVRPMESLQGKNT
jgi:cell division protein FtsQ